MVLSEEEERRVDTIPIVIDFLCVVYQLFRNFSSKISLNVNKIGVDVIN